MCLAVPSRIVGFDARGRATVEAFGITREVDVTLLDEPAKVGDYVLVRAGGFAVERVEEQRALDALALYAEMEASSSALGRSPASRAKIGHVTQDPSSALEAAFTRIQREEMDGVPFLNPALRVEAVGFSRCGDGWLGALVSPWFLNAMFVPDVAAAAREGEPLFREFAAGTFAFLRADAPEVGAYESCALCSRMDAFASQEEARAFAREALRLIHVRPETAAPPPSSKRRFLTALFAAPR